MTNRPDTRGGVVFMKVGMHAGEDLSDIIDRKKREIENAGFAMWGYGGGTCHPTTMVQPFARMYEGSGQPIILCMQPMVSRHTAEPIRASEYSIDGVEWSTVPDGINVLGSRYALCIKDLEETNSTLALSSTRVAVGNSQGKSGDAYVRGHVDKACLELVDEPETEDSAVKIQLKARIIEPYAVFLR